MSVAPRFGGFVDGGSASAIPDGFFQQLLPQIHDPAELKVTLYALWLWAHVEGGVRALVPADFDASALGLEVTGIDLGLERAAERGSLICIQRGASKLFFPNSSEGRRAAELAEAGKEGSPAGMRPLEQQNVFKLYEENLGVLTPLIADALKDAENLYSAAWIADAIEIAVKQNKRNWKYCEAILKRWKEEGRGEKQARRDDEEARQRDVEDKIRKYLGG